MISISGMSAKMAPVAALIALVATSLLSACGGSSEPEPAVTEPVAEETAEEAAVEETEAPEEESATEPEEAEEPAAEESAAEAPAEEPAGEETSSASGDFTGVRGVAMLDGEKPKRKAIQMSADPGCAALHSSPVGTENALVTSDGEIMNVFVYVKNGEALGDVPVPTTPAKLDQVGCMYTPHLLGVRAEQPIDIINSDPLAHNIHGLAEENREFNFGQPTPGTRQHVFRRPEKAITIKCDIHPWMNATVFVMAHPYFAMTDNTGSFSIPDVPAGNHTLVAWHETFGEKEMQISVPAGGGATADFTFTP